MSNANLYKRIVKVHSVIAAGSTNAQVILPGRCVVLSITQTVNAGTFRTTHLFDTATTPNPATDSALCRCACYGGANTVTHLTWPDGLPFSTGLSMNITNGVLPSANTAVSASDVLVNITYAEV